MSTCDKYPSILKDKLEEDKDHLRTLLKEYRTKVMERPAKQGRCGHSHSLVKLFALQMNTGFGCLPIDT